MVERFVRSRQVAARVHDCPGRDVPHPPVVIGIFTRISLAAGRVLIVFDEVLEGPHACRIGVAADDFSRFWKYDRRLERRVDLVRCKKNREVFWLLVAEHGSPLFRCKCFPILVPDRRTCREQGAGTVAPAVVRGGPNGQPLEQHASDDHVRVPLRRTRDSGWLRLVHRLC
jgi:hypothetical protein